MNDVVRIKLYVDTGFYGAKHEDVYEHPRSEWNEMTQQEREELLEELAVEFRNERVDCSAWVMEDDE